MVVPNKNLKNFFLCDFVKKRRTGWCGVFTTIHHHTIQNRMLRVVKSFLCNHFQPIFH